MRWIRPGGGWRRLGVLAASLLAGPTTAAAQQGAIWEYQLDAARSEIGFEGSALLGEFRGLAGDVRGWAEVRDPARLRGARGEVRVYAASIRTGIGLRDRHLREALEADAYPVIAFRLERLAWPGEEPGAPSGEAALGSARLHGVLFVKQGEYPVVIPVAVVTDADSVVLEGALQTRLSHLGIPPPARLGGLARMRDAITLRFHAVFVRTRSPDRPGSAGGGSVEATRRLSGGAMVASVVEQLRAQLCQELSTHAQATARDAAVQHGSRLVCHLSLLA